MKVSTTIHPRWIHYYLLNLTLPIQCSNPRKNYYWMIRNDRCDFRNHFFYINPWIFISWCYHLFYPILLNYLYKRNPNLIWCVLLYLLWILFHSLKMIVLFPKYFFLIINQLWAHRMVHKFYEPLYHCCSLNKMNSHSIWIYYFVWIVFQLYLIQWNAIMTSSFYWACLAISYFTLLY